MTDVILPEDTEVTYLSAGFNLVRVKGTPVNEELLEKYKERFTELKKLVKKSERNNSEINPLKLREEFTNVVEGFGNVYEIHSKLPIKNIVYKFKNKEGFLPLPINKSTLNDTIQVIKLPEMLMEDIFELQLVSYANNIYRLIKLADGKFKVSKIQTTLARTTQKLTQSIINTKELDENLKLVLSSSGKELDKLYANKGLTAKVERHEKCYSIMLIGKTKRLPALRLSVFGNDNYRANVFTDKNMRGDLVFNSLLLEEFMLLLNSCKPVISRKDKGKGKKKLHKPKPKRFLDKNSRVTDSRDKVVINTSTGVKTVEVIKKKKIIVVNKGSS